MAIIPPKKMQSIRFHPNPVPTATPSSIMQKIMVHAAIMAAPPTFTIFLKLNSSPNANNKKMTPISAHVCMFAVSITEGVYAMWGLAKKPATTYPNTNGCFSFLKTRVIIPAHININAKSAIKGAKCDIIFAVYHFH